jgi:hypothetical protein
MTRLELVRPSDLDALAAAADADQPGADRYVPHAVPDHGAQPRYRARPTRPVAIDPIGEDFSPSQIRKVGIARALAKIARSHAPKLSWRTDTEIEKFIEAEALPDARFVAGSLPPADRTKVLDQFVVVLRDEISIQRGQRDPKRTKSPR